MYVAAGPKRLTESTMPIGEGPSWEIRLSLLQTPWILKVSGELVTKNSKFMENYLMLFIQGYSGYSGYSLFMLIHILRSLPGLLERIWWWRAPGIGGFTKQNVPLGPTNITDDIRLQGIGVPSRLTWELTAWRGGTWNPLQWCAAVIRIDHNFTVNH